MPLEVLQFDPKPVEVQHCRLASQMRNRFCWLHEGCCGCSWQSFSMSGSLVFLSFSCDLFGFSLSCALSCQAWVSSSCLCACTILYWPFTSGCVCPGLICTTQAKHNCDSFPVAFFYVCAGLFRIVLLVLCLGASVSVTRPSTKVMRTVIVYMHWFCACT